MGRDVETLSQSTLLGVDFLIFVTLGTQDKSFERLLTAIQTQIDNGNITDRVVVQAGYTKFKSNDMDVFDLLPIDEFEKYMEKCNLLITHGGVGSIINGLKRNKVVIAAPRLKQYGEHTNDHQLQIIDNFSESGYLIKLDDFDKLDEVLAIAKNFKPNKYVSNTQSFIEKLEKYIDTN